MSNVFLSTALLYLASEEVGCLKWDAPTEKQTVDDQCDERVFGLFQPAALITNTGVAVGLMAALVMPIVGAIVDFTPYRWTVGVVASGVIVLVQVIQIWTNSNTWFIMAMLQAIFGVSYHIMSKYCTRHDTANISSPSDSRYCSNK